MIRISAFADEISQDPLEQIEVLTRHGIRHIEFRAIHGKNVLDLSEAEHKAFRDLLASHSFGLSAIASPVGKIRIDEAFEPHLERFAKALELAEFYGTPRVRIFSFYIPSGQQAADHRGEVMNRLAELTRRAEARGVTLLLENEKGIFGDNADRMADILTTVNSPILRHAFDPANYVEVGQPIDAAWARLKSYVVHFHVKDYDSKSERNVPAGTGDGLIPRLLQDAVDSGYEGFCVLEPHLVIAGQSSGFTGPERFGDAASALKKILDERNIAYS